MRRFFLFLMVIIILGSIGAYIYVYHSIDKNIFANQLIEEKGKTFSLSKEYNKGKVLYFKKAFLIISGSMFLLTVIILILFSKLVRMPLVILTKKVKEVTNGDFTVKAPEKNGKGEVGTAFNEFNKMTKFLKKQVSIQKYVSKSTTQMIENLKTGEFTSSPKRDIYTVFFSDIRGFTKFSEKHDPLIVITTINEIFDVQVKIISKYSGDIDKFVGDEIMATFPSPEDAFKASIEIQKKMISYNKSRKYPLKLGIGIHYGESIVGAIGSGDSYDWTTIGDTVNIASRLCSIAEADKIYISEDALKEVKTTKKGRKKSVSVKGKTGQLKVFVF